MKTVQDAFREIGKMFLQLADEISTKKDPRQPTPKAVKLQDVSHALGDLSRSGKNAKMRELLAQFGAKRVTDVSPDQYEELFKAAKEAMK